MKLTRVALSHSLYETRVQHNRVMRALISCSRPISIGFDDPFNNFYKYTIIKYFKS